MNQRRFWAFYSLTWTAFALLYSVLLLSDGDMSVAGALQSGFWTILTAAVLGLAAWRVCSAVPWTGHHRIRFAVIHAFTALAYTGAWSAVTLFEIAYFAPGFLAAYIARSLVWSLLTGALVYGVIVGVAYVLEANRKLAQQRVLASRAELQALRAQLDPHFLFNTLHSITALVRSEPRAVEDALIQFGALLRYVLDANRKYNDDVPLEDELAFVRLYLALEQLRLGARLKVVENIDPDTLDCVIPSLTLQPLLENAIRHGIAPRAEGGALSITTRLTDDRVTIEIADNGLGTELAHVGAAGGLGLKLVRKRLDVRFHGNAMMNVHTESGKGFTVSIVVPAESTALRLGHSTVRFEREILQEITPRTSVA